MDICCGEAVALINYADHHGTPGSTAHCVAIKTLLLALLLQSSVASAPYPRPVLTPLHYVAYQGQPDVRFHCSAANASEFCWNIYDDTFASSDPTMGISFEMDHLGSNLTISPLPMISSTCVQCRAKYDLFDCIVQSDEAILQMQGTLDECRNLTITSLGTYHQSLTWDPPPTLNITAVEPDISGYVVCDNIRTQCTHIDTREAGGDSHNMLQYVFPNVRTGVNFTVTAVNIVGDGEVSSVVYQQCQSSDESSQFTIVEGPAGLFPAEDLSAVVSFDSEGSPSPSFAVNLVTGRKCFDVWMIFIMPVDGGTGISTGPFFPSVVHSGQGKLTLTYTVTANSTLGTNTVYDACFYTMDHWKAGNISFSTYDVQDAVIHGGAENISIQCVFGSGSQARGCHVKFTSITNIPIQVSITRSGNHTAKEIVTGLAPGSYEVRIFDWEEDGSIATTSSHQDHVQVTSVPTTAGQMQPTSLSVEHIAAIGGGSLGILVVLVLVLVIVMVVILVCQHLRREKMPKKLESNLERGLKGNVYELEVELRYQRPVPCERLDSKIPSPDGSPTDPLYDFIPPNSPTLLDCNPTDPLYDIIPANSSALLDDSPTDPLYDFIMPTSLVAKGGGGMSQLQSSDGVYTQLVGSQDTSGHIYAKPCKKKKSNSRLYAKKKRSNSHVYTKPAKRTRSNRHIYTKPAKRTRSSSHIYTKPAKMKLSVRKRRCVTASPTDGDPRGTSVSSDQRSSQEGSDGTPPLPPRNYVSSDFEICPPQWQLCTRSSADNLVSTRPARQRTLVRKRKRLTANPKCVTASPKRVTASPTDLSATDGDSIRTSISSDQCSSQEGSDVTPPLPPRNYVSSEFEVFPPQWQLCTSTSANKLDSTEPARQCTSCNILPGSTTTSTPPRNTGRSYFSLQYLPGISVLPASSDQSSHKQEQQVPCDREHS